MNADTPVHRVTRLTVFTKSKLGQTCLNSFSELHPRIITRPEENKTKSTRKRGRPLTHGLSNRPIYRSFWEAKRRCTDSRHKDYQNYGGRGIEFRFISASDLLAAIGDRPPGRTLDRIDTDGHYELGNVRWSSSKEQANNRRPANRARYSKIFHTGGGGSDDREAYLRRAKHWLLSIKLLNQYPFDPQQFVPKDRVFYEEQLAATSLPKYDFSMPPDRRRVVGMPSLNCAATVSVCLGPLVGEHSKFTNRRLLRGTENIELKENSDSCSVQRLNAFVGECRANGRTVLVWGDANADDCDVERFFLTAAGRLTIFGQKARILLAAEIAEDLSSDDDSLLQESEYLFLPDLKMWPRFFGRDRDLTYRLGHALLEREGSRRPTVIHITDDRCFSSEVRSMFRGRRTAMLEEAVQPRLRDI